ncbi:deoxyribose-phosphate aldolase [Natronogracilivirgula saccharolytica]|uniref:Deoxyribose-phosphate aldolase n=2 Tax=Natronogracilivirga saccharolytica TaxID=2812953 RepID=A0A8J7UX95_9BACT|nr:deoxyribose-phosphate aldolase [Natronogracilivirga saccharolytica]
MKMPDFRQIIPVDQVGVEERVAKFRTRSIKKESKLFALKLALEMVDLTTLEGMDSPGKVRQLCYKALYPYEQDPDIPQVAAICVYPNRVRLAAGILKGSGIQVASVATSFPSGMGTLESRIDEVRYAVDEGADEIDMVISRWAFLKGEYAHVFDEVAAIKEACGHAHLKVILETGELQTYENVRKASDISMYAGADFIKTSTGKISPAATMPVTLVMLEAIRDFYFKTGQKIGMKPAGGIRDSKTALHYLVMVKETLGADWLTPDLFRFGASSLANDLLMQIVKQKTGHYQSPDYFSIG